MRAAWYTKQGSAADVLEIGELEAPDAGPGEGMARLTFRLTITPGGPMGPMINAMIKPAMVVAAEDLADRIVGHLEQEHGA